MNLSPLADGWRLLRLAAAAPDRVPGWDAVVLTAASPAQAELYRAQMQRVRAAGRVAPGTRLEVVADPAGKRIGSGGATLHVLRQLAAGGLPRRILVVHAGGDSRRLPWASVLGKAFIPVPFLADPDQGAPTLFEHCLAAAAAMPAALPRGGLVCLSGDVLPLVPPRDLLPAADGATVVAAPAPLATALRHGVVVADGAGAVRDLLQKPAAAALAAAGGILPGGNALIDTGIWSIAGAALDGLAALAASADDPVAELLASGEESSLYEDIAAAWLPARHAWLAGRPLGRRLLSAAAGAPPLRVCACDRLRFLHFGTGTEVADHLGRDWDGRIVRRILADAGLGADPDATILHSRCDAAAGVGAGSLVAGSRIGPEVRIGRRSVVIGAELVHEPLHLGDHRALWQVAVADGWATAVVGVDDNPKDVWPQGRFLGQEAGRWMAAHGVTAADLWPADAAADARTGWTARLFPVTAERGASAAVAWMLAAANAGAGADAGADLAGHPGAAAWRRAPRRSLAEISAGLDAARQIAAAHALDAELIADRLRRIALGTADGDAATLAAALPANRRGAAAGWADTALRAPLPAYRRHRLAGDLAGDAGAAAAAHGRAWQAVAAAVAAALPGGGQPPLAGLPAGSTGESHLGVRIDLAGGWTDTPPACLEQPAKVLNLAVALDGALPIGCRVEAIAEPVLAIRMHDGAWQRLDAAAAAAAPAVDDPLVLARLAAAVCGAVDAGGIRQGLRIDAWSRIPKGSGLGGSSILAAALVQAIQRLAGRPADPATVSGLVLLIEQRLSTGGGWQDQLGALVPGAKLLGSLPQRPLRIAVQEIPLAPATLAALHQRLVLIHTGIQRLARDVLQRVMGGYLSRERPVVAGIRRLADLAEDGRELLAAGDLDGLGDLLGEVWAIHQQLDPHCSNPAVEALLAPYADRCRGWKLTGAGGGGFAILMARDAAAADSLRRDLARVPGVLVPAWRLAAGASAADAGHA